MAASPAKAYLWQPILQKLNPGFITQCEKVIDMADHVVKSNLENCMFQGEPDASQKAQKVVEELGSHAMTKMHARHIDKAKAEAMGLKIVSLEKDNRLQDLVLSVHHCCMLTFEQTAAVKLIENQRGTCYAVAAQSVIAIGPQMSMSSQ